MVNSANFKRDIKKLKEELKNNGITDEIQWEVKRLLNSEARYKDTLIVFIQLPLSRVYLNRRDCGNGLSFQMRSIKGIVEEYKVEKNRQKEYSRRNHYRNKGNLNDNSQEVEDDYIGEEYSLNDIFNSYRSNY